MLFIWHAFDALIHFVLEGSFLYHCFFSSVSVTGVGAGTGLGYYPDPFNYLGMKGVVHGSQAGGENAFAKLWMVYARADKRWGGVDLVSFFFSGFSSTLGSLAEDLCLGDVGVWLAPVRPSRKDTLRPTHSDLAATRESWFRCYFLSRRCTLTNTTPQGVVSLELLTVFVVGPMACLVCYDIAKKNPRANVLMVIIATAELYGGMFSPLKLLFPLFLASPSPSPHVYASPS